MKKLLTTAAMAMLAITAVAQYPSYTSLDDGGNGTAGATVIFPSKANTQIRLVSVNWQSDSNTATLEFKTATTAYRAAATNTTTGVTQVVNSVVGMAANDILVLERAGTCYTAVLSSTNSATNAVLAAGGWGVAPQIGDNIYKLGTATSVPVGATTNWQNGEALFVGNAGRPVQVTLTPALTTNRLRTVTARYDTQ
jgi:hypothetical protein